jgi:hypothetical protein
MTDSKPWDERLAPYLAWFWQRNEAKLSDREGRSKALGALLSAGVPLPEAWRRVQGNSNR